MNTILSRTDLSRLSIGITGPDGKRIFRTFSNNGQGELVEQPSPILQSVEPDGDDSHPHEPPPPTPPTLRLDAVRVVDFANLVAAARTAALSLDRFLQLHPPRGTDVRVLFELRDALAPFAPDRPMLPTTTAPLKPISEVSPMALSAAAVKLAIEYLERIADEEHPAEGIQKGFTPRELGTRRRVAHEKLMRQLAQDGIQFTDRADVTELARRVDTWLRE